MKKIIFEIIEYLSGRHGSIYTIRCLDEDCEKENYFNSFIHEYSNSKNPLEKESIRQILNKLEEAAMKEGFLKTYFQEEDSIFRVSRSNPLRLFVIWISENEIIIGNGGYKKPGRRSYNTSARLAREFRKMVSLNRVVLRRMKKEKVLTIKELLNKTDNQVFEIEYKEP